MEGDKRRVLNETEKDEVWEIFPCVSQDRQSRDSKAEEFTITKRGIGFWVEGGAVSEQRANGT